MADIREDALTYLGPRMRTKQELVRYLSMKKAWPQEEARRIANEMQEAGYLDDIMYTFVYAEKGRHKGRAMKRIKQELSQLGVSELDIMEGFARIEELSEEEGFATERERCRMEAQKILGGMEPDHKALAKAGRKLAAMGYDSESIYAILGEYMNKGNFNGTI